MTAPRLEIDLDKVCHNARTLVDRLAGKGITVTGVTKATLGSPSVARAMRRGGVVGLADSRVENLARLRLGQDPASEEGSGPLTLLRSPMGSQIDDVVQTADISCNTELVIIDRLNAAAARHHRSHGVLLMVELGDLREGVAVDDVLDVVRATLRCSNLTLAGLGTNLACRSGVVPDDRNMAQLSFLVDAVEATFGIEVGLVSGGNSANLDWALGTASTQRINNLRLGEAVLLGREPLHRRPVEGLHLDAITLVAEVIESKRKPTLPWGDLARSAFGDPAGLGEHGELAIRQPDQAGQPVRAAPGSGFRVLQSILALGRQDVDPAGLEPPRGCQVVAASSDHLIVVGEPTGLAIGAEMVFGLDYSALLRAMTSPFVAKVFRGVDS